MNQMPDYQLALLLDRFVRRMHSVLHTKAASFDADKIGPLGAMALLTVSDLGPTPIQSITARLARDKSQMTRVIHMLEEKGMITRETSATDSRVTVISLTRKGEAMVVTHRNAVAETIHEVLGPITEDERGAMIRILERA